MMLAAILTAVLLARESSADCGSTRRLLPSSEVLPIILDDSGASGNGIIGWSKGILSACLEDAYNGTFRHDNSLNKGRISAAYTFDPPKDGCYVIEEYHPGMSASCSQRLPTNARIDVDWCKGKSSYTHVDQSLAGGQWNILGALPFFVGWQGRIRVGNSGTGNTCKLGKDCLWVADAFKVTWVSDLSQGCKVPTHYGAGNDEAVATTFTTTLTTTLATIVPAQDGVAHEHAVTNALSEDKPNVLSEDKQEQAVTNALTTTLATPVHSVSSAKAEARVPASQGQTVTTESSAGEEVMVSAMNIVHQALLAMQTVVDDASANSSTSWQRSDCGSQGWQHSFLYQDPGQSSVADADVEFMFDPPSDGCYVLEEFHPETLCGRALSSAVSLSIHYCKGMKRQAYVDQSRNGNRWNTVGTFPFYMGIPGKILVHSQAGSTAAAVADAFRFTRISSSCDDARQASIHYHRLSQNAAAILVDNHHALDGAQGESRTCGGKAIGGNLHAASTGEAEAKFEFLPTSTGCYRLDSFHPENERGEVCGQLADEAALEVNWCLGKQTKLTTSLRGNGNRWNTVGHFKFYAGTRGNVISRRVSQTPNGKFWVADAFRFTKVSESCDAIPNVAHFSFHITSQEPQDHIPTVLEAGITSYTDMRMALHEAVVEATDLPLESVKLLSIRKGSVIADFEVQGSLSVVADTISKIRAQVLQGSNSSLAQTLCKAVVSSAKGQCNVAVMQDHVLLAPAGNQDEALHSIPLMQAGALHASPGNQKETRQTKSGNDWVSLVVCIGSALLCLIMAGVCYCSTLCCSEQCCSRGGKQSTESSGVEAAPVISLEELPAKETVPEEIMIIPEPKDTYPDIDDIEKGKPCDECSQSGSTITPTSSHGDCNLDEVQSLSEISIPGSIS